MREIRKNEFKDLMERNEFLYVEKEFLIQALIPSLGNITYYPKKDRVQISNGNKWVDDGFYFIKNHLEDFETFKKALL